ncbi:cell envelope biogenesis protein OmpA [Archangium sp. Cb G35]|uniref:OmpA family protein n=1 Tax=Archangium sp. Cb G35 TaxID=1920190 RepID=UPI0009365F5A|nr:OmpA family protein [Archangium sp. Cb G35]OJT23008.1 cell envelope biogenesis protein OmpA [Archangium sp. Cb G35]
MRRISMVAGLALAVTVLAGCPPTYPKCNSDETCQEKGEVCVNGSCQECASDANCKEGFACQENKCVPKGPECSRDEQCTGGKICEAGKCAEPQCTSKDQCQGAQECQKGRCALPPGACNSNTDCGGDQECKENKCVAVAQKAECNYEPLRFGFNESTLPTEAQSQLSELAQCIKDSGARIELGGHADERGTEEYNLQLSQKRAASVKKYLVDLGVPASQLKTVGYGENKPVEQGATEESWAANRRVEFVR